MKILSTKTVFTSRYFKVIHKDIERNGKQFSKEFIERIPSVLIIPYNADNSIYLVSEFRDAFNKKVLNLIGGKMEQGDDPLESAKRELKEEAGLTAKIWKKLYEWELNVNMNSKIYLFAATDLEKGEQQLEIDEEIDVVKFPVDTILEKVENGEISTTEDIAALLLFDRLRKEGKV
jgi:ADP-ribose diphosphatase